MKRTICLLFLTVFTFGCNANKLYKRELNFSQSAFLAAPAIEVDLSGIPADWVRTRTAKENWGDMKEEIEFDNAQGRRVRIVVLPVTPTTQPDVP
ncbi:MAG TPA: hypothetical protein VF624_01180 [Tepidisphaeraceae bacterium]|jgi:hypothetical protein